ncbi:MULTISPECIES: DUF6415 family natural product biosynthesis protein [Streptomyces]|uniref:DUF6415 family natural product biosynthesis protein n=1 Tax=Streptomyces lienomycini TaxID=284035 RepID=A0ABV9WVT7_9ACTN|nr:MULTISPECIES: DUF6415 family natural product biosynthesis protein [Streptomyces]
MANATTPAANEAGTTSAPPDIATVRATARRLLAADAESFEAAEVAEMTARLREDIAGLIPAVEALTRALPKDDVPRACALACIGEARMRLRLGDGDTDRVRLSVAVRMARTANALADHHQALGRAS